ncbi:hypothetical protein [Saccharopolyspora shandongensis]|uniref:hypothetical protein n=1 Tax=Saccharopolyspora shandongensis TaxID=418495 RepID=UPI0033DA485A
MDHVEDVTPHELRHAAIPNDTIDSLTSKNLLALSVLTNFVRHSAGYGQTLTKLVAQAGGQGKTLISAAYNLLIDEGYLGRVEFGYERPAGDTGRSGRRATVQYVSRVPVSQEAFEEIVRKYTPGRYVMVQIGTGEFDERGREVHELRRVKVLSAEIYCHRGALRIDRDGMLSDHDKARNKRTSSKKTVRREQPQRHPKPGPSAERPPEREGHQGEQAPESPEVEKSTSGATCNDAEFAQVAPEVDSPESGTSTSINKTTPEDQEDEGAVALAGARLTPEQTPAPPGFTPELAGGETPEVGTTDVFYAGDHRNARADDDGVADEPMSRDAARELIRSTLRKKTPAA